MIDHKSLLKYFLLISGGGIALMGILLLVSVWQTGNRFVNAIEQFFSVSSTQPEIDLPTLIVKQIRGVSKLTTAVFVMEAVVPTSGERKFGQIVVGKTSLLYIAYGEVRAGVALTKLKSQDIQIENKAIKIQLPAPQILDRKIDVTRSRVYSYDRGFLGLGPDVAPQLQELAQRQTLEKIVSTACTEGLLEQANERAELAIAQLLTTAGYERVEVTTTTPTAATCQSPPS